MYTPSEEAVFYPGLTADIKKTVCWVRCVRSIPVVNNQGALDVARHSLPPVEENRRGYIHFSQSGLLDHRMLSKWSFKVDRLPSKKASDVIYCLKAHMARHGLCM